MNLIFRHALACAVLCELFFVSGCGRSDRPELGTVSGNVTMGGQPLTGVIIYFKPDVGRPATATTDSEGNYELVYRHGVEGTKVGPSTISFEWPLGEEGKPIPRKYAPGSSELKEEVQPGENVFDFALESR